MGNAIQVLQAAAEKGLLVTHGESWTLYTSPTAITFTGIRRQRVREMPELGGILIELTIYALRSAFASLPAKGLDVGQGTARWRLADVRDSDMAGWIELVLEAEVK